MTKPLNIAHRGARAHAPENTLAAAQLAHMHGADMWELDTGLTKDGQLVVIHDDSTKRTTNAARRADLASFEPWKLAELDFKQIRSLDAGTWFTETDPFKMIAAKEVTEQECLSFKNTQIPTLEEALLLTKKLNWKVNVEIKDHTGLAGHSTITAQVTALIKKLDMVEQVLLSSFQLDYLLEAYQLLPEMQRGALVEEDRPKEPYNPVELCKKYKAHAYHPQDKLLTQQHVTALQNEGIAINVWTVNTIEAMEAFTAMGVTGLITDFPARLKKLHTTK